MSLNSSEHFIIKQNVEEMDINAATPWQVDFFFIFF